MWRSSDGVQNRPENAKKVQVKVAHALDAWCDAEADRVIDKESVKRAAIEAAQNGIVFMDEIDKLAKTHDGLSHGFHSKGQGVQKELLTLIEGSSVRTRHGVVRLREQHPSVDARRSRRTTSSSSVLAHFISAARRTLCLNCRGVSQSVYT